MKIWFLIQIFIIFELFSLCSANYCASTLCPSGVKHVACNHNGKFDSTCSNDAAMVSIGANLKKIIVNVHNNKRNYIAGGNVAKFKPACRMATMKWDAELAKIASYNVRQCKMSHDKCRNTPTYKYSGQNLAWRSYTGTPNKAKLIKAAINAWYSEFKDTKWEHIQSYPKSYSGPAIGHFTALMGERNIAVGCAAATYSTKGVKYKTFLVACNYATTNIASNSIYNNCAKAAAKCKVGRNSKYPNLCAPKEVYNVMGDTKETHGTPQFKGEGFDDWQFRVKIHLDSLNLMDVLTGDPPSEASARAEFMKKDKRAKERIETAKDMWSSLQNTFAKKSVVNQLLLRKKLAKLRMNDSDSIVAHVLTFENLVRQLKLAGATMEDSDVLAQLFLTLPEKYDPLVTALQNMEGGKLDMNLVKERLIAEEIKLMDRSDGVVDDKTAFSTRKFVKKKKFKGKWSSG
ncbi:uncharacterized protein [Musca autumnalis]|uniref:uncharacterized protein n=1 Tax=Musca autumnalis TaxID=221902 RepID=UPI003CF37176